MLRVNNNTFMLARKMLKAPRGYEMRPARPARLFKALGLKFGPHRLHQFRRGVHAVSD